MREYFCAYHSMRNAMRKLSDAEVGRLFRGLLYYSETGEEPDNLQGRESIVFDIFSQQIDREIERYNAVCERNKRNGANGGQSPRLGASRTQSPRTGAKISQSQQEEEKDKEENKDNTTPLPPPGETAAVVAYAMEILPHLTPKQVDELTSYRADLPDDLICHAIDIAADKTRNWGYVKGILNRYIDEGIRTLGDALAQEDKRRQEKRNGVGPAGAKEPNPAQNYLQREYKPEDFGADFFEDLTRYAKEAT